MKILEVTSKLNNYMISTNKDTSNKLILSNIYNKISIYFLQKEKKKKLKHFPCKAHKRFSIFSNYFHCDSCTDRNPYPRGHLCLLLQGYSGEILLLQVTFNSLDSSYRRYLRLNIDFTLWLFIITRHARSF